MLKVKEFFGPTIQGEGSYSGLPAVFVRFSGCNQWNGKPQDRAKSNCPYCDTDFLGGDEMAPEEILREVENLDPLGRCVVVMTGGEPLLQPKRLLAKTIRLLQKNGRSVHVETNGTVSGGEALPLFDHVTVSPKQEFEQCRIDWHHVHAVKMLYPHPFIAVQPFISAVASVRSGIDFFVQPIDTGEPGSNWHEALGIVLSSGEPIRFSLQLHKLVGME